MYLVHDSKDNSLPKLAIKELPNSKRETIAN